MATKKDAEKSRLPKVVVMKFLEKWTNSDGVEDEEFSTKVTCRPNCDSSVGGPPLVTISFALFLVIFHYSYDGVRTLVQDRKAFVDNLREIVLLLPPDEWEDFENIYSGDVKADFFNNTESWLNLNTQCSKMHF